MISILFVCHGNICRSTRPGDIADPWYTGNFDETYEDVLEGCQGLLAACLGEESPK